MRDFAFSENETGSKRRRKLRAQTADLKVGRTRIVQTKDLRPCTLERRMTNDERRSAESIADNLRQVKERIDAACDQAGRDPQTVTLIAVTKTVHPDQIKEAYEQGHRHFGENRLQEAIPKIEQLPNDITWHYIGKLQSNKAKKAAQHFPVIHTLESEAQLRQIEKQSNQASGLIELNLSSEAQKSGISVKMLDDFHTAVIECNHVRFRGLMTVGPNLEDPEGMRPYFKELRRLGEQVGAEWLSMGMSGDFEVAIQEGATHVRVGSAIFGSRK